MRSGISAARSTSASTASTATSTPGKGDKVAYYWEGEPDDERRAISYADLQRDVVRFANALKKLGVQKGTPVAIYMGMVPELPVAMLACTRLGAPHTVDLRRLLRRLALRPHGRHGVRGADHAGRGLAARHDRAAEEDGRRGDGRGAEGAGLGRPAPHRQRRADAGRPRPLVARARGRRRRRSGVVPVRADGQRGPALPHVHERDDRDAEGHRAHDRRLPLRRRDDASLHLRPEARVRRLLVRRRHRLDHRAQLHRLRAAVQRRDVGAVRGDARLPGQGPLVVDRRALRRDDPLHRADGDPRAHEVGPGVRAAARPVVAAPARLGRRADQSRGVDLVSRARRRRPHADRRHVVADRDRA